MTTAMKDFAENHILAVLPHQEAEILLPHLERTDVQLGDVIDQPHEAIQNLFFPLHAAISMTDILSDRHTVEVTITGPEGCSGASIVQGSDLSVCLAIVQIGGAAARLPSSVLLSELPNLPFLQRALQRYNALLLRHAVVSAGCNRFHSHVQRLARWLKAHWDRTGLERFPFTMDFLAAQIGLDREIVTEAVGDLQRQNIVIKHHKSIEITDHEGLTAACCECFALCKDASAHYEKALQEIARMHE